jgi:hypothetical protein
VARKAADAEADTQQAAARVARDANNKASDTAHEDSMSRDKRRWEHDSAVSYQKAAEVQQNAKASSDARHATEVSEMKAAKVLRDAENKASDKAQHAANMARDLKNKEVDKAQASKPSINAGVV